MYIVEDVCGSGFESVDSGVWNERVKMKRDGEGGFES